ncbi:hypothetical protein FB451DRAFT_1297290, partial [Mycena latifolia]
MRTLAIFPLLPLCSSLGSPCSSFAPVSRPLGSNAGLAVVHARAVLCVRGGSSLRQRRRQNTGSGRGRPRIPPPLPSFFSPSTSSSPASSRCEGDPNDARYRPASVGAPGARRRCVSVPAPRLFRSADWAGSCSERAPNCAGSAEAEASATGHPGLNAPHARGPVF